VKLYSGCDFGLDERYAEVLLVIGMALFYGTAMPLMYLFALTSLIIMYVRETLFIYYLYQRPPQYDSRGTVITLYVICILAVTSLPFAFWQLGNRQIFDNLMFTIHNQEDIRKSGHTVSQAIFDASGFSYNSGPFLLLLATPIVALVFSFYRTTSKKVSARAEVEGLTNFSSAMRPNVKKQILTTEKYFSSKYGIQTMTKEQYYRLENAEMASCYKVILDESTYRLAHLNRY